MITNAKSRLNCPPTECLVSIFKVRINAMFSPRVYDAYRNTFSGTDQRTFAIRHERRYIEWPD